MGFGTWNFWEGTAPAYPSQKFKDHPKLGSKPARSLNRICKKIEPPEGTNNTMRIRAFFYRKWAVFFTFCNFIVLRKYWIQYYVYVVFGCFGGNAKLSLQWNCTGWCPIWSTWSMAILDCVGWKEGSIHVCGLYQDIEHFGKKSCLVFDICDSSSWAMLYAAAYF